MVYLSADVASNMSTVAAVARQFLSSGKRAKLIAVVNLICSLLRAQV